MRPLLAAALLLAVLAPCALPAQGAASAPTTSAACTRVAGPDSGSAPAAGMRSSPTDTSRATLRILASVSADEVRFIGSPVVCVRLSGDAQLDSVRVTARRNIVSPVVSNTTYRDVYVAVEILGRLNAECIAARITGGRAGAASMDSTRTGVTSACAALDARAGAGAGGRAP